jgi:hypothetical protein
MASTGYAAAKESRWTRSARFSSSRRRRFDSARLAFSWSTEWSVCSASRSSSANRAFSRLSSFSLMYVSSSQTIRRSLPRASLRLGKSILGRFDYAPEFGPRLIALASQPIDLFRRLVEFFRQFASLSPKVADYCIALSFISSDSSRPKRSHPATTNDQRRNARNKVDGEHEDDQPRKTEHLAIREKVLPDSRMGEVLSRRWGSVERPPASPSGCECQCACTKSAKKLPGPLTRHRRHRASVQRFYRCGLAATSLPTPL